MADHGSRRVILAALGGNLGIALVKAGAAVYTGSSALLAEAIHSTADTGNQLLLLVGILLAKRRADERHSFGYGKERYFWPFAVALTMFSLGALFSIYEGVHKLLHPEPPHGGYWLAYLILGTSIAFESFSCWVAMKEFGKVRKGKGFFAAAVTARDPTVFVVVFEDLAALIGLVIAFAGIGLTHLTRNPTYDSAASIAIGILLALVALFLGVETRSLLIGESAVPEEVDEIRRTAGGLPGFVSFRELRTLHLSPEELIVEAVIEFQETLTVREVRLWIDRFEVSLREKNAKITHVTVEPA